MENVSQVWLSRLPAAIHEPRVEHLVLLFHPDATMEAMRDGWFWSGDAAVVFPDGYIQIRDRLKDVIISGGENVSSVEVEAVLYEHPAVKECAVIGKPDSMAGELRKLLDDTTHRQRRRYGRQAVRGLVRTARHGEYRLRGDRSDT